MADHKQDKKRTERINSETKLENTRPLDVRFDYVEGMAPNNTSIPDEYCEKCGARMTPYKGLRVNKNGTGRRYYKCPVCKNKESIKVNVVIQPEFLLIPDHGDTINKLCRKVADEFCNLANACYCDDCESYGLRKWTGIHEWYMQSQVRYPDVLKEDEWVDHLLDSALKEVLTEDQMYLMLRMVFWAAWGQNYFGNRSEMVERLNGRFKTGDVMIGNEILEVEYVSPK